jgi:tetratricopeptide (TPR) repeat protein
MARRFAAAQSLGLALGLGLAAAPATGCKRQAPEQAVYTVGDVQAVHSELRVGGREIRGSARLRDGDDVATGADGRARLRLDDGALVVVDSATRLSLRGTRLTLESGRLFVQGATNSRVEIALGAATTAVSSSAVAFERKAGADKIYCAQGDLVVTFAGRQLRVASGETATLAAGSAQVLPEKAFDDWTGGLAVPWSSEKVRPSALGELRGGSGGEDPGSPLVVRSEEIAVEIEGEVAHTRTRTTYFNGSDQRVDAELRMAIPEGAILSHVAQRTGNTESNAALLIGRPSPDPDAQVPSQARVEWAGGGSLRGTLPGIGAGESVQLTLEYSEWLSTRSGQASYRFPLAGGTEPPLIGELRASIDAEAARSPWLSASTGATVQGRKVTLAKSDVRATGDLVVELSPAVVRADSARAYVAPGPAGEDPYLLVRAEVPEQSEPALDLAVVLDTSMSVGSSALETERAVLDALLEGLGPRDSIVVLAADQTVRSVGPDTATPVTPALRGELETALSALRPGGASNLGLALERAADALDAQSRGARAGSGMVVYIGDGRPTMGEPDAEHVRRRLSRRATGMPRIGAVAVGPGANRWLLAQLVNGTGAIYEVVDRADAARSGAALLADALEPTLRDVSLDLGPTVDRVYPRETRATPAGSTLNVVGRLRGDLPTRVGLRFRDGEKLVERSLPLYRTTLPRAADVAQRWAQARIAEISAQDDGLEPAIALAASAKLLTPWTGWFFDGSSTTGPSRPFAQRLEELSPESDAPYARWVEGPSVSSSMLLEPPTRFGGGVDLKRAAELSVRRILEQARQAIRACRDARAAVRPEVGRSFEIDLSLGGDGHATRVHVSAGSGRERDRVLERCVEGVVASLPYFAAGLPISVIHSLTVPEARAAQRTTCSATSKLSLPIRRAVWRARSHNSAEDYAKAAKSCELPSWSAKRELLLLMLEATHDGATRLGLANQLDALGETDAATFVRKEALRRVTSFAELSELSQLILANEPAIDDLLEKAYRAADSNEARLDVVRRFLRLSPHSALARRRLFALLEALERKDALISEITAARNDPFADAGLLALGASALNRMGYADEARRAFGELMERAPGDPWTLGFVGDRLRAEQLFDEAVEAYESLARLMPNDAGVGLRLALAHAGAGRLDIATRLLERVTQTGGRGDDGRLGELASITQAVLLASARSLSADPDVAAEITRRLLQTPLPDVASVMVIQAPPSDEALRIEVARERGDREAKAPDFDARALGLSALRIERGEGSARLRLSRPLDSSPSRATRVKIAALVLGEDRKASRIVTREVEVGADGKPVELRWNGEAFL